MEGVPTPENIPTKEEILKLLEVSGYSPENIALVTRWTEEREKEVQTARDGVVFNIDRIEFYVAAGDAEGAFEAARYAYENAMREGEEDLVEKLVKMFPELDMPLE